MVAWRCGQRPLTYSENGESSTGVVMEPTSGPDSIRLGCRALTGQAVDRRENTDGVQFLARQHFSLNSAMCTATDYLPVPVPLCVRCTVSVSVLTRARLLDRTKESNLNYRRNTQPSVSQFRLRIPISNASAESHPQCIFHRTPSPTRDTGSVPHMVGFRSARHPDSLITDSVIWRMDIVRIQVHIIKSVSAPGPGALC